MHISVTYAVQAGEDMESSQGTARSQEQTRSAVPAIKKKKKKSRNMTATQKSIL